MSCPRQQRGRTCSMPTTMLALHTGSDAQRDILGEPAGRSQHCEIKKDERGVRATQTMRRLTSQRRHLVAFGSGNHATRSGSWKQAPSTRLRRRLLGQTLSRRHACSGSSSKYFARKYWACRQHAAPAAAVKEERSYFSCRNLVAKQMLDVSSDVS